MAICQLCGIDRKLIDAHIIPKSFWNINQDGRGPLAVLSSRPNWQPKRSPLGEYDNNILCAECDNILGRFDQHFVENLVKAQGVPIVNAIGATVLNYDKADAAKVHALITSIAWRASKSQRDYFGRVQLGPYENLLKASFGGDVDAQAKLDCFMSEFDERNACFLNPQYSRFTGVRMLVIYANRFTFYVKVDRQETPEEFRNLIIREGRPVLSLVRKWEGSKQWQALRKLVNVNPRPKFWKKIN
jgi:hypothetical protein